VTLALAAIGLLFVVFGLRTALRHATEIVIDDQGIAAMGPLSRRIEWKAIQRVKLSYYATRRDRQGGWMHMTLRGQGGTIRLDSALEGFDDIARRAGLSKGTIYLYFANKEELFREVVRTVVVERIVRARNEFTTGSALERLEGHMRSHWEFVRSRELQVISRLVTTELRDFPDLAAFYGQEVITPGTELLGGLIRRGIEAGEFRAVDPYLAARTLSSMFITHASWCEYRHLFQHLTDVSDDQVFAQLSDFFVHAISARPAASSPGPSR
jgi:AcrR family transcriptional regulator